MKIYTSKLRNGFGVAVVAALLPSVSFAALDIVDDVNIDGTVTIQSVPTGADFGINDDGAGVNPTIPETLDTLINPIANTTPVYTQLGGATVSEQNTTNTGIIAETNGNLTLLSDLGTEETLSYIRAVRNDIFNFDQPNAGLSAQAINVGGYIDDNGTFIELGLLDLAETWDPAFVGTPLEGQLILDPALVLSPEEEALLISVTQIPGTGGNLQVGGNANVSGVLSAGSIADVEAAITDNSDTLDVHFGLVSQNIADIATNAGNIAGNTSAIQAEAATRAAADDAIAAGYIAADAALAAGLNAEEVARATADNALQGALTQEASTRAAFDTTLQANITAEAAARASADTAIVAGYQAADAAIVAGYQAADAALAAGINDVNVRVAGLKSQIEQNTRGIAMVAAMTSPTVREGMVNAMDFHVSYFEGETGVAASYARRINENVQLNVAAASTTDFEESVVRAGVSLQW